MPEKCECLASVQAVLLGRLLEKKRMKRHCVQTMSKNTSRKEKNAEGQPTRWLVYCKKVIAVHKRVDERACKPHMEDSLGIECNLSNHKAPLSCA